MDWSIGHHTSGMKFSKTKCGILYMGWDVSGHRYKLGEECLEMSPAEQDLGLLVGSRLTVSQQCAWAAKRAICILGISDTAQPGQGDFPAVLSIGVA